MKVRKTVLLMGKTLRKTLLNVLRFVPLVDGKCVNTVRENMAKMDIKSGVTGWPPKTFNRHVLERADFGWTFKRLLSSIEHGFIQTSIP